MKSKYYISICTSNAKAYILPQLTLGTKIFLNHPHKAKFIMTCNYAIWSPTLSKKSPSYAMSLMKTNIKKYVLEIKHKFFFDCFDYSTNVYVQYKVSLIATRRMDL